MIAEPAPIAPDPPALPGRTVASQRWSDLAFLHWRVDPARVARLLPVGTTPDVFDGSSWVGLIGFHLGGATLFGSGPIPFAGSFAEINVRLYTVDADGRRGVVFRSLEASRLATVLAARAAFSIPYVWSHTSIEVGERTVSFTARRHFGGESTTFGVRATGHPVVGDPLADFLTARWGLHTRRLGRTIFLPNTHERWSLEEATLDHLDDELVAAAGLAGVADRSPDSVLVSAGVTARFGPPVTVGSGR